MKKTALKKWAGVVLLLMGTNAFVAAQTQGRTINVVTTAVPFLRISPDARAGAMGDLAVAISPDASASYYNLGKVVFNESNSGINLTYTPWLKKIVPDVYLAAAAGYYKFAEDQAISGSLRYFSLGQIQFTDQSGMMLGSGNPREFGIDIGYSRRLSTQLGLGIGLKYIYSNLAAGYGNGSSYKPGNAVAADLGLYYNNTNTLGQGWSFGAALTNLGSKISYTNNVDDRNFIPANLGIGSFYTRVLDESNRLSFGIDINKLLVPTPPVATGDFSADSVAFAKYRSTGVLSSWFSSFGDAPDGFSEELKEFQVSIGAEYEYNGQFAFRAGYFYEDETKGNRRFFTAGVGVKYNVFGLNFSYLIPTGSGNTNQNPLSNTLRFSLVFDLGAAESGTE